MVRSVRVRRAMRRPGKCEESDNQETGLCVAALCASKWVPTTIHNAAHTNTVDGSETEAREQNGTELEGELDRTRESGW